MVIYSSDDIMELNYIKSIFEKEEIHSFITDEHITSIHHQNIAYGGMKLNIKDDDYERASRLLEQILKSNKEIKKKYTDQE